ncbi:MAG: SIS domain-containing protein [Microbacterium sp.]|uniref:D-sedoheptulose-7-phosphate isomerase n=1 Tax=Microbacterium sp. TaxID=51671 RepID=UPI001ACD5FC6|nr:SIS domain-containing protein [Microbacterium sp.]MBN9015234.1 SIS domain-containing protein [Hyphomicrobiales bacterium]MBN9177776.1 SIS domain-containing protein [Microbacterium sp.]
MRSVEAIIGESAAVKQRILADTELLDRVRSAGDAIVDSYRRGGRLFTCGNGGSAADAQHFSAEMTGHFTLERPPLAAEALHANTSHMTAVGNDYSYDDVFARALQGGGRRGDVLAAFTTSGNSTNVIRATEVARDMGITVVGFTGESGGRLADLADILLNVPSDDTGRIQESHVAFLHAISEHVEHKMFGNK